MNEGECIFCKIVRHEASAEMVGENASAVAFRDIHPKAPVHILVVPREHHASLAEMRDSDASLLGQLLAFTAETAREAGLSGYKVVMNVGREAGQLIEHLHLHILGGWGKQPTKVGV